MRKHPNNFVQTLELLKTLPDAVVEAWGQRINWCEFQINTGFYQEDDREIAISRSTSPAWLLIAQKDERLNRCLLRADMFENKQNLEATQGFSNVGIKDPNYEGHLWTSSDWWARDLTTAALQFGDVNTLDRMVAWYPNAKTMWLSPGNKSRADSSLFFQWANRNGEQAHLADTLAWLKTNLTISTQLETHYQATGQDAFWMDFKAWMHNEAISARNLELLAALEEGQKPAGPSWAAQRLLRFERWDAFLMRYERAQAQGQWDEPCQTPWVLEMNQHNNIDPVETSWLLEVAESLHKSQTMRRGHAEFLKSWNDTALRLLRQVQPMNLFQNPSTEAREIFQKAAALLAPASHRWSPELLTLINDEWQAPCSTKELQIYAKNGAASTLPQRLTHVQTDRLADLDAEDQENLMDARDQAQKFILSEPHRDTGTKVLRLLKPIFEAAGIDWKGGEFLKHPELALRIELEGELHTQKPEPRKPRL